MMIPHLGCWHHTVLFTYGPESKGLIFPDIECKWITQSFSEHTFVCSAVFVCVSVVIVAVVRMSALLNPPYVESALQLCTLIPSSLEIAFPGTLLSCSWSVFTGISEFLDAAAASKRWRSVSQNCLPPGKKLVIPGGWAKCLQCRR